METFVTVVVVIALLAVTGCLFYNMVADGRLTDEELDGFRKWLEYAVLIAQGTFGEGTGRIKFGQVYGEVLAKFPKVARILGTEGVSDLIDEVKKELISIGKDNDKIRELFNYADEDEEDISEGE
mgnify:CR=1 FL=1